MGESITFLPLPGYAVIGAYTWRIRAASGKTTVYLGTTASPNGWNVSVTPSGGEHITVVTAPTEVSASGHFSAEIFSSAMFIAERGTRYLYTPFTYQSVENVVTFNWANSPFVYNAVTDRAIASWEIDYGDGTIETLGAVETVTHEYPEEFWGKTVTVRRRARDQYNFLNDGTEAFLGDEVGFNSGWRAQLVQVGEGTSPIFGSFVDKSGALFTAVNDSESVQVSKFKSGTASREFLAVIPNAKNPSLFKIGGTIYCAYTDRTDNCAKIQRSTDGAHTFSMPIQIWPATHQNATVSPTADGGAVSGAAVKGTNPTQYEYRRSPDVRSWSASPVAIGTGASKMVHVHQKSVAGQSTLIATDGVQLWISWNMGKNWDPI